MRATRALVSLQLAAALLFVHAVIAKKTEEIKPPVIKCAVTNFSGVVEHVTGAHVVETSGEDGREFVSCLSIDINAILNVTASLVDDDGDLILGDNGKPQYKAQLGHLTGHWLAGANISCGQINLNLDPPQGAAFVSNIICNQFADLKIKLSSSQPLATILLVFVLTMVSYLATWVAL